MAEGKWIYENERCQPNGMAMVESAELVVTEINDPTVSDRITSTKNMKL